MDSRLAEMLEYETSSAALSKSNSVISESLATPSVAEELEPIPSIPKTAKLTTKKQNDILTPQKQHYNSILLKTKKYIPKKENFKTMINKELELLHLSKIPYVSFTF